MEKSKKAVSYLLAAAALTTVTTASVNQNVKAENDVKVTTEPKQETGKVSAVVLENEQGAVIRVTAHEDVQKVKTTYTVDGTQAKTVNFGNLTKGQVKDIQVSFGTQAPAVKSVKRLPNTAVVSDRVEFAKTVKSHAIKGSVSFEYETKKVLAIEPDTPVVPTKPTDSVKPVKPVDTTKPVTPTKPVDTVKPTEPTKPVDVTKPAEPVKPVDTTKPTETVKPVEAPKPVEEPTRPEPKTRDPHVDKNPWKEETRTRTVTVDEEYTENTTEDVFEEKQLFDDWFDIIDQNGKFLKAGGWVDDYTQSQIDDMLLSLATRDVQPQTRDYRKVRETKKVKVGTKTVPVTKVRKVQKQETYTVWVNTKTGEVRTERP